MCWTDLLVLLPAAPYQLAAFPFAALFHHLCALGCLSPTAWYIFLLAGGCLLAYTAMGSYTVLLLIPAAGSMLVLLSISPARAHTWVFALQMSWQTLCHLALSSQELDLQDATGLGALPLILRGWRALLAKLIRCSTGVSLCSGSVCIPVHGPAITLSTIMPLTQKATSLARDSHEDVLLLPGQGLLQPLSSYLLFFPALLGDALCSFSRFQAQADIHPFLSTRATSQGLKLLYRGTTWVFTQPIVAYMLVAVKTESFFMLCLPYNSILPLSYGLTLLLLAKKLKQN
ncbi:ghrelin O-acyltransferase [Podargus strigoides]